MNNKLVKFKLHGNIWDEYKIPTDWEFKADTLSTCIKLLEMNTKKFYKSLHEFDKRNIRYEVIINGRKFKSDKELTLENVKDVYESELMMKYDDLETVDIVPVFEGANSDIIQAIIGVILIIVGIIVAFFVLPLGVAIAIAGVGLLASGIVGLLTKPPKFEDFREIESGGKTSYLFSGPANIIGEGGPVPVGYGRLIVGSQVISAAYVIRDFNVNDTSQVVRDEYGNLIRLLK